jgi:hypothetical protein
MKMLPSGLESTNIRNIPNFSPTYGLAYPKHENTRNNLLQLRIITRLKEINMATGSYVVVSRACG